MIGPEKQKQLAAPFAESCIEWRVQKVAGSGAYLCAYLTARAVMDRLDEVFGVGGWSDNYIPVQVGKDAGFLCTLTCEGVSKQDVSDLSDIESLKGGVSGALKRAAVKFGIGRYLYDLDQAWAPLQTGNPARGVNAIRTKDGHYVIPGLPDFAKPAPPPREPRLGPPIFMSKFSETFKLADGHTYDMLLDYLDSINRPPVSEMNEEKQNALLIYLKGGGKDKYLAFVKSVLASREKQQ